MLLRHMVKSRVELTERVWVLFHNFAQHNDTVREFFKLELIGKLLIVQSDDLEAAVGIELTDEPIRFQVVVNLTGVGELILATQNVEERQKLGEFRFRVRKDRLEHFYGVQALLPSLTDHKLVL